MNLNLFTENVLGTLSESMRPERHLTMLDWKVGVQIFGAASFRATARAWLLPCLRVQSAPLSAVSGDQQKIPLLQYKSYLDTLQWLRIEYQC